MTNAAPSATIAAIVKVIGLVSAPNNGANHLSSPPAFAIDAKTGAITVTTLAATLTKVPSANNTGPIATTIKPSHFCQPAIGKLSHISPSTRLMLSANVTTELFKLLNNISMFAPSLPNPAAKSWNDAFIIPNEPLTVSSASSIVVPVTPISVCTSWMASTIVWNGTSFTVSAVTSIESPKTPDSLISRAISPAVPPYFYIRHESLIHDRSLMNCYTFPHRIDYILCFRTLQLPLT